MHILFHYPLCLDQHDQIYILNHFAKILNSGPYPLVSEFSSSTMANGQSTGIFVDGRFNIYVTEPSLHLVQVFDQSGTC